MNAKLIGVMGALAVMLGMAVGCGEDENQVVKEAREKAEARVEMARITAMEKIKLDGFDRTVKEKVGSPKAEPKQEDHDNAANTVFDVASDLGKFYGGFAVNLVALGIERSCDLAPVAEVLGVDGPQNSAGLYLRPVKGGGFALVVNHDEVNRAILAQAASLCRTRRAYAKAAFTKSLEKILASTAVKDACKTPPTLDVTVKAANGSNAHSQGLAVDIIPAGLDRERSTDAWGMDDCFGVIEGAARQANSGVCFPFSTEPWHLEWAGTPACRKFGEWDAAPPDMDRDAYPLVNPDTDAGPNDDAPPSKK